MSVNTPTPERRSTETIRSLTVVAGPTAVGKSSLLRLLAEDDRLRERLRIPKAAPAFTAGGFLKLGPSGPIDELILHYDFLRPHHKRFGSHDDDPATSTLAHADAIAFLTLRTTPERLAAQLDHRIASHERPPKKHRRLQPLYRDNGFVADWYERWFAYIERFRQVTTGNYVIDVHRGYRLTAV